jgi:putative Mn2+ efflux pump MntP
LVINSDFLSIFLIALGLSADCFAVAISGGIANINHSWPRILRVSFSFGLFQALMPVLGWLAGRSVVGFIVNYDHWVAFALLAIVSSRMLWESFRSEDSQDKEVDITKGLLLITLSIATSIDALAVGLSFAFLKVNIAMASLTIGAVAFLVTTIGFVVGKRVSKIIGKRAEAIGGIILLAIAFRILLSHIL